MNDRFRQDGLKTLHPSRSNRITRRLLVFAAFTLTFAALPAGRGVAQPRP
jgi:hypothetical protein